MGVLAALFTAATVTTTWRFYRTIESSLSLQFQNEHLVHDLQIAKESTEALNQELERRVRERTSELHDSNERLRAEIQQREQMEQELIQVRNLESLGVLAGGIAHDFNNFLTVIQGNIELAKMQLDPEHSVQPILAITRVMNLQRSRRGRPPGMSVDRLHKRLLIAQAIASGTKIAAVARQLGVSRSWASREAHAPGTRQLLAELLARRAEEMEQILHQSWHAIMEALVAEKVVRRKGQIIAVGPDYRVRLAAAGVALEFYKKLGAHHWAVLERVRRTGISAVHTSVPAAQPNHRVRLAAAKAALPFITALNGHHWAARQPDTSELRVRVPVVTAQRRRSRCGHEARR